jgi:hypothetical protein
MADDSIHAPAQELERILHGLQDQIVELRTQLTAERTQNMQQQQQAPQAQAPVTTYVVKPPRPTPFHGKKGESIDTWIGKAERYFELCQMNNSATRTRYAVAYLEGNAALWWQNHIRETLMPISQWDDLKTALVEQFKPVNSSKIARDNLAKLRQSTSVQAYIHTFRAITLEIDDIAESEKLDRFIRGLKDRVRQEVELQEPTMLDQAARIAERYDTIAFTYRPRTESKGVIPMELDSIQRKPLTKEEREKLRREGGCFYCRAPGHIASKCSKKRQLLAIESEIENDESGKDEAQ